MRFSVAEAREVLPAVQQQLAALQPVRARLATLMEQHARDEVPMAEVKGAEARLSEILDTVRGTGAQVKGYAPLLLDFVWDRDAEILLCWLEGEDELGWWHHVNHGFLGRRPMAELPTTPRGGET